MLIALPVLSNAAEVPPFKASCVEGETHRYDGGNGLDMLGKKIENPDYGWSTEKWGNTNITWSGGETIVVDALNAAVVHNSDSIIVAIWMGDNGAALNLYSLLIDTTLSEAFYAETSVASR